jgi:NADPH:quinone reductase
LRAAWYEKQGPAAEVLQVGETADPHAGPGEVRVRVAEYGIHIGGIGKRQGYWGSTMSYPRVIPHGDGTGPARIGERVWVYLAQSYRPFGTAAEYTVVPAAHAVPLPPAVPDAQAAGLGIPGIAGHRAVLADGPVTGKLVLVTGALGAVGRAATAVARRGGPAVVATVRHASQIGAALETGAHHAIDVSGGEAAERMLDATSGRPVDRVGELALDASLALNEKILTVRFLSNDDFPEEAHQHAARDLTEALVAVEDPGTSGRVLLKI